jgi:hypothetical protein
LSVEAEEPLEERQPPELIRVLARILVELTLEEAGLIQPANDNK